MSKALLREGMLSEVDCKLKSRLQTYNTVYRAVSNSDTLVNLFATFHKRIVKNVSTNCSECFIWNFSFYVADFIFVKKICQNLMHLRSSK